jgi:hypothetical protein
VTILIAKVGAKIMNKKYSVNPTTTQPTAVFLQDGQVYYKNSLDWYSLKGEPKNLIDVTIAFDNNIYGLDGQGHVHRWVGAETWQQDLEAKNVVALTNDGTGHLWCVNTQGQVYCKPTMNSPWQYVEADIPTKAADGVWDYTVRQGDWLWKIVSMEYCPGSNHSLTASIIERIKVLNPSIVNWNMIQPGLKLKMPPR